MVLARLAFFFVLASLWKKTVSPVLLLYLLFQPFRPKTLSWSSVITELAPWKWGSSAASTPLAGLDLEAGGDIGANESHCTLGPWAPPVGRETPPHLPRTPDPPRLDPPPSFLPRV